MKWYHAAALATLLAAPAIAAQTAPPATDIYLVRLRGPAGSVISDPPVNLTHRPGYDNEPAFTPDGRAILFASIRGDGQADVYRVDITSHVITRVTRTPESEYSPTPMPGRPGFSVVRVERDSAQRLWAFHADGSAPTLLLPGIAPVGYFVWLDAHRVALYVLGKPNALEIADLGSGKPRTIAHDIGRSLQRIPGSRRFSFVQHADSGWYLETADPDARDGAVHRVIRMLPKADYVVWESPTAVLTAVGTMVYRLDLSAGAAPHWTLIADFREDGLRNLSRLALSPDGRWLAIVAEPARR